MTRSTPPPARDHDPVSVHHFIRLFGHAPTPAELARYRRARARLSLRLPSRIRRGTAKLIVKL